MSLLKATLRTGNNVYVLTDHVYRSPLMSHVKEYRNDLF